MNPCGKRCLFSLNRRQEKKSVRAFRFLKFSFDKWFINLNLYLRKKNRKTVRRISYILLLSIYSLSGFTYLVCFEYVSLFDKSTVTSKTSAPIQLSINSFKVPKHTLPVAFSESAIHVSGNHGYRLFSFALPFCIRVIDSSLPTNPANSRPVNKAPPIA